MAEILPGSFAPAQSVQQTPAAAAIPPPGIDSTARTQRATPASQDSEKAGDRRRTIEDKADAREEDAAAQTRTERRRADAAAQDQRSLEQTQREEADRERAVRDRHGVDVRF